MTGATGALGPRLVRALVDDGWAVRTLSRTQPAPGLLPEGVDVRRGDVAVAADVCASMEGVHSVFHLAGLLHNPRPAPTDAPRYEAVNVGGALNVARAAAEHRAFVIAFSTIAVYGPTPTIVDETSPPRPRGLYAATKRRGEEVLLDTGQGACVLRLAAVYGRRMKGNYQSLVRALRLRLFVPLGDGTNRRTLVHEEDVARAALLAAQRQPLGILNVTDGCTHTMAEILSAICQGLDRPEPTYRVSEPVARFAARLIGRSDTLDKYLENVEVRGALIQKTLGFVPKFDLVTGWTDALRSPERS